MISEYVENSTQQGDDLISAHLSLVKRIANHLAAKLPPHIELEDLIQVGLIGLLKANEDYQVDSGASFSTYATIRIRGAMMDELRTRDWLPRSVQKSLGRVSYAMQAAEQRLGRTPKDSEVAYELGASQAEYQELLREVSFARLSQVEDVEIVAGDAEPDNEVFESMRALALADAIKELPEKEQLMMSLYYVEQRNLKEIGLIMEVSESRVSQIHGQAIARLKGKLKEKNNGLIDLLNELENITDVNRYRISSIEPNLLSDEIIKFVSHSKKFLPHFHIPLQSGSDTVLRDMKRRYNSTFYSNLISKIKRTMPNASIGVDVIVGFPTETYDKFLDTYNFLQNLDVSYFHVFKYSDRENTLSYNMSDKVPEKDKSTRSQVLRDLSRKKKNTFYEANINRPHNILWESENKRGYIHGFTTNYIKVRQFWNPSLVNKIHKVKLTNIDKEGFARIN